MDTPKITTEDRLHCVFCHRPMSETAFLRRKVANDHLTAIVIGAGQCSVCVTMGDFFCTSDRCKDEPTHIVILLPLKCGKKVGSKHLTHAMAFIAVMFVVYHYFL
jgi:hypothetical protein